MILSNFDKFIRLVGIKPPINLFKTCYQLVVGFDGGNDFRVCVRKVKTGNEEVIVLLVD